MQKEYYTYILKRIITSEDFVKVRKLGLENENIFKWSLRALLIEQSEHDGLEKRV